MKKGVKRRLTQGTGESAGSSASSSRRSREAAPAADSSEKRRRDPPSQTRVGEKEKRKVRSPSPRPTSTASSGARLPQETSTPSRRDETDKSVERSKDESPVRRTPARKKRARKISSDSDSGGSGSSSSCDSSSSSNSSSSEDEAMAEDKVIDKSEEEQLRVLEEKREAHKRLKSRMRKKATRSLIRKAKRYEAALRKSQETEKEAEETEAEQQEEEAVEAETSEADLAATEWEGRNRKERSIKRIVRERHIKDRLGKPAPPAAGETSMAVADKAERLCRPGKPAPPATGENSTAVADKPEGLCRPGKPAPPAAGETSAAVADSAERLCRLAGYKIPRRVSPICKCYLETTQERFLFGILVDAGMVLSGKQAKDYIRPHFRFQRREDNRKFYSD
jgi:hypothetical protein